MKKRVFLLAVSCKNGGLCPGGLDLDNPDQWIRIVANDGKAGAVQGSEIDFAKPLDVIVFDGKPMPQGRQQENWVILNGSCKNAGRLNIDGKSCSTQSLLNWAYKKYSYHGFWGNYKSFLNEEEFKNGNEPSESIMMVSNVRIYSNDHGKAKIDFNWSGARYPICGISMTDQEYYDQIEDGNEVEFDEAMIVMSIPKDLWINPNTNEGQAYKFVSKVFEL